MASLIQAVRNLTMAGPSEFSVGTANYWDDNQIQTILDRHRAEISRLLLTPVASYTSGGTIQWKEYRAETLGNFEATDGGTATFVVQDGTGATAGTASYSADYARGIVEFSSNQHGTSYYLTGRAYDIYGASADLLTSWSARESRAFDFDSDGQSFKRSQKAKMLREAASDLSAKAWAMKASFVRDDLP